MARETILVVDDEKDIRELIGYNLSREGYQVDSVPSGEDCIKHVRTNPPDLIILDLMLPGVDGLEVCRKLKGDARNSKIPIIMLTAKGEESDIVVGLELGADDYITKPFSPRVLLARTKAVLRRKKAALPGGTDLIKIGDLFIHPGRREVLLGERQISLTSTEFSILHLLARRPGWVFTRYQIIDNIQGKDAAVTDRSVDFHLTTLRRKLGPYSKHIETVWGVGYKFKE